MLLSLTQKLYVYVHDAPNYILSPDLSLFLKLQTCVLNSSLDISAEISNKHNLNMFETEWLI